MRRSLVIVLAALLWATQASGSDACATIHAAIVDLPATGGTVDARNITGTQDCANDPFKGVNKPVEVLFSAVTINTAASWVLPGNATLRGGITETFTIRYTGAGVAVDAGGSRDCTLVQVRIETTNDAATGLQMGNASVRCSLDHVFLAGTNTSSNTGIGLLLNSQSPGFAFSGHLAIGQLDVRGYKYGMKVTGAGGQSTWTTITCINCFFIGRPAGHISNSIGIWFDANANGTGSSFVGGAVEEFQTGVQIDNGGGNGVDFAMDMEGNDTTYSLPPSYNGQLRILNGSGKYEAQANGTANRWNGELRQSGNWFFDNRNNFAWTIYDDSTNEQEFQWNRGPGLATGGSPTSKFKVHVGISGDTEPGRNYWSLLGHKFSAGPVKPAGGTCALGDIVFNTTASPGGNVGWICTGAGSPGMWSPWGTVSSPSTPNYQIYSSLGLGGATPLSYGTITMSGATENYILTDTNTGSKMVALQAGGGSITGGSLVLFPHNHVSARDSVKVGLYDGAGIKFCVNNQTFASGTDVFCVDTKGFVVANGGIMAPKFTGALSGNAATATALAADPVDCSGNDFSLGINASGVALCAQPAFSNLGGAAISAQLPTAELLVSKNAASGYAGLTAGTKLNVPQGQKVWALTDLTDVTATAGAGSTVMLNEAPVLKSYTVEGLPPAETADRIAIVTDAATTGSCTSGGGSNRALCRDTGSAWEPLGDGGGAVSATKAKAVALSDSVARETIQIPSAEGTLVGGSVSPSQAPSPPSNPNNVRLVGLGGYSTIQEALDTLPNISTPDVGGTVHVMPNYSETMASNISITTENTTIEFLGPAVLTMGTNSVEIPAGLRNVVIRGAMPWGGYSGSGAPAVTFDYRGTGAAIQVGGSAALTENIVIENLNFRIGQAGPNAVAINATYVQRYQFNNIRVNGSATVTQVGIQVQGGSAPGQWSGAGIISLPYILMRSPGSIGVQYSTLGNGRTNQNEIRGGNILGALNSSGIGVSYASGSGSGGNAIYSLNIEGFQQGVHYTARNVSNVVFGGTFKNNGLDIQFGAGANNNEVHGTDSGNSGLLTVIDNGANNIVWSGGTIVSGLLRMAK